MPLADRLRGVVRRIVRRDWRGYFAGMATETAFILTLALAGLLLAVVAQVLWR